MPYETIGSQVREAIKQTIFEVAMPWVQSQTQVVIRRNPEASGLESPACVISPLRNERRRSPAGMRVRIINSLVSLYFRSDDGEMQDQEKQQYAVEAISAAFDLPVELPEPLVNLVPQSQESRVLPADKFLPAQYRYHVDAHRLVIGVEVCQLAGVIL